MTVTVRVVFTNDETTYTYSPYDAVTVRAPHGIDLRAEHCPWHCGP